MRFRRALDRGNVTEALSSASELEHVGLAEALELCLLLLEREPHRYGRAALRWHGNYCRAFPDIELDEGLAVLGCLAAFRAPRASAAARALAELPDRRGLERIGTELVRWSTEP
jgi:hypothetical protein